MRLSLTGAIALCAAALLLPGCPPSPPPIVPAEGTLTVNGQPLPNAYVQFIPMVPGLNAEYIATATTDDQGHFKLTCHGREGACACENKVTVGDPPMPEEARGQSAEAAKAAARFQASLKNRPIPEQYANVGKTPVSITVTADRREYEVKLQR